MPEEELLVPAPKGTVKKQNNHKKGGRRQGGYHRNKKSAHQGRKVSTPKGKEV